MRLFSHRPSVSGHIRWLHTKYYSVINFQLYSQTQKEMKKKLLFRFIYSSILLDTDLFLLRLYFYQGLRFTFI